MEKHLEIKPLEGLGNIKFGMSPSGVIAEMSEEQIYEDWMGGNLNYSLHFKGILFHFYKWKTFGRFEDAKLGDIDIKSRGDVLLFKKSMNDWNEKEFLIYCKQQNIRTYYYKKHDIILPELGIEICFDPEDTSVWIELCEPKK